jgi:hypothetical protein
VYRLLEMELARSSTSNRRGTHSDQRRFCGAIIDVQTLWIGSRDPISTPPLAFSLRNTGDYPALSDPVIMIGSIPLWG